MREYSKVSPSFWTGQTAKQIKSLGFECRIAAMYLLTCPQANMIGLYYLPIPFMAYETGLSEEGALKALGSLSVIDFCHYDTPSEIVWVVEMARYQIAEQLKPSDKQVKGIINAYNSLPKNPFKQPFYDKYKASFHLNGARPLEGPSETLRSQEQEQENEYEHEYEQTTTDQPR